MRTTRRSPFLRPLLPFLEVRRFDPALETEDTPLAGRPDLHGDGNPVARSNLARFAVLYRHGGVYADMDTMFLRDLRPLFHDPRFAGESVTAGLATAHMATARCCAFGRAARSVRAAPGPLH